MTDDELLRYSRHILLDEIGIEGQERLLAAHALVIGAGGLGSPVALYLGTAGVGRITLVDDDAVDLTNLQRQIAHDLGARRPAEGGVGQRAHRGASTPTCRSSRCASAPTLRALDELVAEADVVIDCSDNFATRQAVNAGLRRARKPLVVGRGDRLRRPDLRLRHPTTARVPCYACVFPPDDAFEETPCATMGVFAPLVGHHRQHAGGRGAEAARRRRPSLAGRLQMLDARTMEWTEIRAVRAQPDCPVCGRARERRNGRHPALTPAPLAR